MSKEQKPNTGEVQVRGLISLREVFKERNWPTPYSVKLEKECSALKFAQMLNLPLDKIESVFINRKAYPLDWGWVKPGDRVAFVSPGTPGPVRFLLGIAKLPESKQVLEM